MSSQSEKPFGQGTAVVSLVAALTCACAGNALASRPSAAPEPGEAGLSARVAAVAKRVQAIEPTLLRDIGNSRILAQWRNR